MTEQNSEVVKEEVNPTQEQETKSDKEIFYSEESTNEETTEEQKAEASEEAEDSEAEVESEDSEASEEESTDAGTESTDFEGLKVSEESRLSQDDIDEIVEFAKDNKLTSEQAQKLLDQKDSAVNDFVEHQQEEFEKVKADWKSQCEADKEIGGDKFPESIETARRAIDKFATDEFKNLANETGFGNHPEVVRVFSRIGKAMGDDSFIMPGAQSSGNVRKTDAEVFYGQKD